MFINVVAFLKVVFSVCDCNVGVFVYELFLYVHYGCCEMRLVHEVCPLFFFVRGVST